MADKMEPTNTNPKPDLIAQVGEMLQRMARSEWSSAAMEATTSQWESDDERFSAMVAADNAIVVASAILAVAAELRDINNTLNDIQDSMPSTWTHVS